VRCEISEFEVKADGELTSEHIRREDEKLRETTIKLIEHAKTLMEKSVDLKTQISYLNRDSSKRNRKP
jgi:hypothetical protein